MKINKFLKDSDNKMQMPCIVYIYFVCYFFSFFLFHFPCIFTNLLNVFDDFGKINIWFYFHDLFNIV